MTNYLAPIKRYGPILLRQLKNARPALLLLGIVFLLIAIWWLGPQWTWHEKKPLASLSARVLLTVLLLLIPILVWALALRRRNKAFEAKEMQAQARLDDKRIKYIDAQQRSLDHSLSVLKASLMGRQGLYKLPWYLVLGMEKAGKTSFINRSNQNFYLTGMTKAASQSSQADPDLAFTIDWWMGDQAVLIDMPGELISQADNASADVPAKVADADADADTAATAPSIPPEKKNQRELPSGVRRRLWEHLIDWLGRNRSRRPLNGLVLVIDVVTLLNQKPSDREAQAILLRTRLTELGGHLGTRPPIYVVLSKLDQIDGFAAFFSRLPRSVREDIFGFTFTLDSVKNFDAWLAELSRHYTEMVGRLNERIFDALSEQAGLDQREGLFSLTRELEGLLPIVMRYLSKVLGSDRSGAPALPRGVYFSSVYQQGLLNNPFVNAASEAFGVDDTVSASQPENRGTVYFAQQLFQRVIYPEAGLAGDNIKVLGDKKRALLINLGVAALGGLLVVAGWQHYYTLNRDLARNVLAKSRDFSGKSVDSAADPTGRNLLGPLDQIRDAVTVYGDYRNAWPVLADMGLYQGRKIGPKVDEAYLQLLSRRFLPELAGGVVATMNDSDKANNDDLAALRVYRMIDDRKNRRPPIVEDWMAKYWQRAFPGDGLVQDDLMRHLDYAMKYADADLPEYRERITGVQQTLRQIPMPQRVYATMQQQAGEALHAPLDLRHEIGPAFDIVYRTSSTGNAANESTRIDALLTAKGFRDYFEPHSRDLTDLAMIDEWTLGQRETINYSEADKQALAGCIRTIYTADYIARWRQGINQLDIVDFADIGQAVAVLENVTSSAAPLRRLAEVVRDNTVIYPTGDTKAKATDPTIDPATRQQASDIARSFAPLTDLLAARGDKPSYMDEAMGAIANVRDAVKTVQDSPDRGRAALAMVLDRFALKGQDPIGILQRVAAGLPEPLNIQTKKLADESSQVLLVEALRELERRWNSDVYSFYSEHLASRYPFNPASQADASLEDFEALFGPQGRLQQFREKYLKTFFEDNLDALYSERRGGYLVRTDALSQLEAANRIRDAFFNNRSALGVQFNVTPLGLTPNRRSSVLGIEGQLIPYDHGPSNSIGLIWPNSLGDSTDSRITLVNGSGNGSSLIFRGPWSMFRLLSRAQLTGASPTSVDLSFSADDGAAMRYRITSEKANNPFTQRIFSGFALPRTLLRDGSATPAGQPPAAPTKRATAAR
ncbi:type VI secretion system membrane subunit TssM [Dyella kyungheensis]|uniref:Type VI secretion system membrane subunit TssM n=1 Tax=Dyella kyungheensis TaxID=1242174 RepID=A0ABS2JWE2_9GAMM|nr:type VI secretion system membrane subunit TssM [Dyella kyungheensis]MBM7123332.1 type VI secretion system membrane subunit TssM [Dyella kyungheensis]